MISTKWLHGKNNISEAAEIRRKVFIEEMNLDDKVYDIYDDFAFSAVICEDEVPVGSGRLLFKDGRYFIDNICVLKEYRGRHYGDLIVRMLVRRAFNMGAEKTCALVDNNYRHLFENIGFIKTEEHEDGKLLMMKTGDVGGHCS